MEAAETKNAIAESLKQQIDQRRKKNVLRWSGMLGDTNRGLRTAMLVALVASCLALSFTQFGFAGIELIGGKSYAVLLLVPIALGALLYGPGVGAGLGLMAGAAQYIHAVVFPLDFYEFSFVTPIASLLLFTAAGFLLGLLFALFLRNGPKSWRRVIRIVLVCVIVSVLYSLGFVANVLALSMQMVVDMFSEQVPQDEAVLAAQAQMMTHVMRVGNLYMQILIDAALMSLACIVGDFAERKAHALENNIGLRGVFNSWLSAVVLVAFMVLAPVSFVLISGYDQAVANMQIGHELEYLCDQLSADEQRSQAVIDALGLSEEDLKKLTDEELETIRNAKVPQYLLDGYSTEYNGTVVVALSESRVILMSDEEKFVVGKKLEDCFDKEALGIVFDSLASGEMMRFVYDEATPMQLLEYREQIIGDIASAKAGGESAGDKAEDSKSVIENGEASVSFDSQIAYLRAAEEGDYLVVVIYPSDIVFANRGSIMLWSTILAIVLLAVVFMFLRALLNHVVVRRIDETNDVLADITAGNLDGRVDIRTPREFGSLSDGINETVSALRGWISEAETRMDAELATAKEIQESALPRTFPPYPDIRHFDIYASMNAAREVGGDFYDFFLIGPDSGPNNGKLGFVVADVSGKGIPAALFMMKAMTQIRDYLKSGMEVGEAVENANRQLCDGNDAGMFVTMWVGVLDYASGHIEFVNAGHNPPLLWENGAWRWIEEKSGMPLGLFDSFPYQAFSMDCGIGDTLLAYTDGVTEAMSVSGEQYGEERLMKLANDNFDCHPRRLVDAVRMGVAQHARGAEQSDDITVLALEVGVPPEITATLTVPADIAELPRVNEFIHTELDRRLCPLRTQKQLDIAVEELFVNSARYAYQDLPPDEAGTVRVSYTYSAEPPSVRVDIVDDGVPFNPLAKPDAVTPDDIMEVPIGGLGILVAKNSVDEMYYERSGDSNIVTIVKRW